jgi:hypothetical protein
MDAATAPLALARGLGWFSIARGLTELIAARPLARALGMDDGETLLQAYGVREIATGIGVLAADDPAPWIWGRVGGDALDLATLATGLDEDNPQRANVGLAIAAVAAVTAVDLVCATGLSAGEPAPPRDYRNRSGWPDSPTAMRGAARDFEVPRDMRIPEPLRPYRVDPA